MTSIWEILENIRSRIIENAELRMVQIGDREFPASFLPAARIRLLAISTDSSAGAVSIIDAQIGIEIYLMPKTTEKIKADMVQEIIELIVGDGFLPNVRLHYAPIVRNTSSENVSIFFTLRIAERNEL